MLCLSLGSLGRCLREPRDSVGGRAIIAFPWPSVREASFCSSVENSDLAYSASHPHSVSHSSLQKVLINKNKLSYCYHLLVLLLLLLHSSSLHNVFQGWENGGSGQAFNPTIVSSGAEGQSSDILASGAHALSTIPRFLPGTQAKLNIYLVGIII